MSIEVYKEHPLYEYIHYSINHFEERLFLTRDMSGQYIIFMPLSVKNERLKFALLLSVGYHVYITSLNENSIYLLSLAPPTTLELDFINDILSNFDIYLQELKKHYVAT